MRNKKYLSVVASMLLAGGVIAGCGNATDESQVEETTTEETEKEEQTVEKEEQKTENVTAEKSATVTQVNTYNAMKAELGNAKEGNPVDWDLVKTTYVNELQSAVTEVNGELDQAISAAISAGESKELDANVVRQLIDKTTQSYFYQKQKRLHKDVIAALEAGDQEAATLAFSELKHLANEVLIPTAVKRDGYYELTGDSSMEQNIQAGLAAQEEALKAGNVDDFSVYVQLTDKSVYRSYYLAALSYAQKIEKAVEEGDTDLVSLQNKQAEAWGFFQAIKGSLSGGDEAAATKLNELFSLNVTDPATINAGEVSDLFVQAFTGKISGYYGKAPKALSEGEVTEARVEALEGNVFLKAIEMAMIEKVGADETTKLFDHAQQWYSAIESEDQEKVQEHGDYVVSVLNELVK